MQTILIRNLRRSFSIAREWSFSPLSALHTAPEMEGTSPPIEAIEIVQHARQYRMTLIDGRFRIGSLRDLAARIDIGIMQQGFQAESAQSLLLPAAILRDSSGKRSAFVGPRSSGKTWLSLSLMELGWKFEGDSWVVVHDSGVTPLPRTLRIEHVPPHLSPAFDDAIKAAPSLRINPRTELRAIDPRVLGSDWRIGSGPIARVFFLELNCGGSNGLRAIHVQESFGRALSLCRGRIDGKSLLALRRAITGAHAYRLRLGSPKHAAELITGATAIEGLHL